MSKSAISPAAVNEINSKIKNTDATATSIVSLIASMAPSFDVRHYFYVSSSSITDYPSVLTNAGATSYVQIMVEVRNAVARAIVSAVTASGEPFTVVGEFINGSMYWGNTQASLYSKVTPTTVTFTARDGVRIDSQDCYAIGKVLWISIAFTVTTEISAYGFLLQLPNNMYFASSITYVLFSQYFTMRESNPKCVYSDKGAQTIRTPGYAIPTGGYRIAAMVLLQ